MGFLQPLELSQYQLARSISVPARRINEIVLDNIQPHTAVS